MSIYYGIQNDYIFQKVHAHLESALLDVCIPLLGLNAKDQEYWEEDQAQFVYASVSLIDDHNIIKNASKLLIELLLGCADPND